MTSKQMRNIVINILDDEYGIGNNAWYSLHWLMMQFPPEFSRDIREAVKATEGRTYLPHETANLLRGK
jgi:hypothetical protein